MATGRSQRRGAPARAGAALMAATVKAPWAALAEVRHVFEQAVMEAATRLVSEGDDPVQLLIDVLLQTQQADAATEAPAEGGLTMVDVEEAAQKLGLAQMTRARLRHLFRFLGVQPTGAIKPKELQDGLDVLTELASSTAAHHEVDESKLPAGLQGFTPIAKQAEVQAQTKACAALEAAVSEDASSAAAQDKLRQHTHANLQPAILKAIDMQLQTEGILTICDQAIAAGVGFDKFYTSTFNDTIKPGEAKGLKQLVTEVGAIEQARREGSGCVQQMTDPVALFADAARVRPMARAAMEAVAAQAKGARLEKQGPLKKMARVVEKVRPAASPACSALAHSLVLCRRSRCAPATAAATRSACATLCATCSWPRAWRRWRRWCGCCARRARSRLCASRTGSPRRRRAAGAT